MARHGLTSTVSLLIAGIASAASSSLRRSLGSSASHSARSCCLGSCFARRSSCPTGRGYGCCLAARDDRRSCGRGGCRARPHSRRRAHSRHACRVRRLRVLLLRPGGTVVRELLRDSGEVPYVWRTFG
jgi:hypothetical protein